MISYQRTSALPPGLEATVCWVQTPGRPPASGSEPPTALDSRVSPVAMGGPLGCGAAPGMAHGRTFITATWENAGPPPDAGEWATKVRELSWAKLPGRVPTTRPIAPSSKSFGGLGEVRVGSAG